MCLPYCSLTRAKETWLTGLAYSSEYPCQTHASVFVWGSPAGRDAENTLDLRLQPEDISKSRTRDRSRSPSLQHDLRKSSTRLPDVKYLDDSKRDPFATYPVPYESWYSWLLDFWYCAVLPRARRLIKCESSQIDDYILWSRRFEMTEPALYCSSLFLASGIPVAEGKMPLERALWLRYQAVRALNEALADTKRASSTAVICAVGKIALHEHVYGDRELAHRVHRPAQQR